MKLFNVHVNVTLPSGSKVSLTPRQESNINSYVNDLLTSNEGKSVSAGKPELKRFHKKAVLGRRAWTEADKAQVAEIIKTEGTQFKSGFALFQRIARAIGRTPNAVSQYYMKYLAKDLPINTLRTVAAGREETK